MHNNVCVCVCIITLLTILKTTLRMRNVNE